MNNDVDVNMKINKSYEKFYAEKKHLKVYPTEFVVRTFLANYPDLNMQKPQGGSKVLDIGFGDGRNTAFLCEQGYAVSGIEITGSIVAQTKERLKKLGLQADLRVGRNTSIPFEDNYFDYILACHACYYVDEGETFLDNMKEYARVLKKDGYLVASVARKASIIFNGAIDCYDGSYIITEDYYNNRIGYRLYAFESIEAVQKVMSNYFTSFSFGSSSDNWYGITSDLFWVVAKK